MAKDARDGLESRTHAHLLLDNHRDMRTFVGAPLIQTLIIFAGLDRARTLPVGLNVCNHVLELCMVNLICDNCV